MNINAFILPFAFFKICNILKNPVNNDTENKQTRHKDTRNQIKTDKRIFS